MRSNRVDYEGIEAKILPKYPSLTFTTDGDSRDEYLHYISFQKPFYMLILSNIFTTLLSILAIMSSISYSNEGQDYGKLVFLSDISVGLICITPFIGWILLYHQIIGHHHPQKNIFITWIHQHYELLQFIHLNSMILSYALRLIQRSFTGQCQTLSKPLVDGWNCNPYANFNGFPLDTTLILMLTPFIFTASFREMNIFTYLTAWIITSVSLIVSVMAIGSTRLIAIIVPYIFFSAGIIMDNRKKNTLLFYMTKHIHEHMGSLDQDLSGSSTNQHLHPHPHHHGHQHVGSNHQKGNIVDNPDMMLQEMRYMIGNVAHDLKTPLTSVMTGIDLIAHIVTDFESDHTNPRSNPIPPQIIESFASIRNCLDNIRNTNSFMLMTINRCIDYTKAAKGLKLVPKIESVDLEEAISMPIDCMKNLQSKIKIALTPLPTEICSHIMTDKQWLQENMLCLIANAVKYSNEGIVQVSISLQHKSEEEQYFMNTHSREYSYQDFSREGNNSALVYPETFVADDNKKVFDDIELGKQVLAPKSTKPLGMQDKSTLGNFFKMVRESSFEDYLHIEVVDEGVGIDAHALEQVFHPINNQSDRSEGGTGLGLYSLAKRVEALNGLYGFRSRTDGKTGSIMWFSIPYKADANAAELEVTSFTSNNDSTGTKHHLKRPKIVPKLLLDDMLHVPDGRSNAASNMNTGIKSVTGALSKQNSFKNKPKNTILNILVVDDSPTITKMTKMMLRRFGHHVMIAENGEIALRMIQDRWKIHDQQVSVNVAFDVIVMDLQMPIMDGLQATKELRRREKEYFNYDQDFHHLIIGVSANSDPETTQEAYGAGIDYFIAKPFTVETFYTAVNKFYRYNGKL